MDMPAEEIQEEVDYTSETPDDEVTKDSVGIYLKKNR